MYRTFKVSNFRCFDELELHGFKRINLITGANNVGKTSLLEALFIHAGAYNPTLAHIVNFLRGFDRMQIQSPRWLDEAPGNSIFYNFDTTKTIELTGAIDLIGEHKMRIEVVRQRDELAKVGKLQQGGNIIVAGYALSEGAFVSSEPPQSSVLSLEYQTYDQKSEKIYLILRQDGWVAVPLPPTPRFPALFISARSSRQPADDAAYFSNLEAVGEQDVLLKPLQIIEPRLRRLSIGIVSGMSMLRAEIHGTDRLVPLALAGEGMVRLASLILAISAMKGGVVFIDEIENGLHHSVLTRVWQAIGKAGDDFDVQIFATTHSLECIRAAHEAFEKEPTYDFQLYRLDRMKNGSIRTVAYDQETLEAAIEINMEVR